MEPTLYDSPFSGNAYKCRLMLHKRGMAYRRIVVDIDKGESRTPTFLALNPNGRVPLLVLEDGTALAESNAILAWLARGTPYLPEEPLAFAQTLQWMFFEQYSHEPYIAVARFWKHFLDKLSPQQEANLPDIMKKGHAALDVMEKHLATRTFFVDDRYGLADIALYAYTHVADEGGFDLSTYPNVTAWLSRVKAQPGHVAIDHEF
jgi:glutathione S-transferase